MNEENLGKQVDLFCKYFFIKMLVFKNSLPGVPGAPGLPGRDGKFSRNNNYFL